MKYLHLCCGATRPQSSDWINMDQLLSVLGEGTPERNNLLAETNYRECNLESEPIPFPTNTFEYVVASHCFEHWDCQAAAEIMKECHRVLVPGGTLLVSVPDAEYFRAVFDEDTIENAKQLFGEEIYLPDGESTFFGYGLWNRYHKAILTETSLWAYFRRAGFQSVERWDWDKADKEYFIGVNALTLGQKSAASVLNRPLFSLVMSAVKG